MITLVDVFILIFFFCFYLEISLGAARRFYGFFL
jgi:hypothetical protein